MTGSFNGLHADVESTRSLYLLHSQHKNTDSVYGTQWENLDQIVNNPENLSIYTLDLGQGSFIVQMLLTPD